MTERNVYRTPKDKVLLRTADVYQTEAQDDVTSYSETLLKIVADFKNSGAPTDFNTQSMVGKSKRGEVACRLFARIDPATGVIEAAGFKTRGCLAMTACASAACLLIEGRGIEEALELTVDEVRSFVDGVPSGKVNALYFSVCAVRGLVGDFLMREGAAPDELDEAVGCDELSVPCLMAEHCSWRQSRLEMRMKAAEAQRAQDEEAACAAVFDLVRVNTAKGELTGPEAWEPLVPGHLSVEEFSALLADRIQVPIDGAENQEDAMRAAREGSEFASAGVGIPRFFAAKGESDSVEASTPLRREMPPTRRALPRDEASVDDADAGDDEENFGLVPPEGYKLVEVEGVLGLVATDQPAPSKPVTADGAGIVALAGAKGLWLYDGGAMTARFAQWAYLADQGDLLATFAFCVREDSRVYPRPLAAESLGNRPFCLDAQTVEQAWQAAKADPAYGDICRTQASNGDVYYFSSDFLSADHARSLAEWQSVERRWNV